MRKCLQKIGLFAFMLVYVFGCSARVDDEVWKCYDETGNPIPNVLIACMYGLSHRPTDGVEYRFTGVDGSARFRLSEIPAGISHNVGRSIIFVYSPERHAGERGSGVHYLPEEAIPVAQVYSPYNAHGGYSRNIFFRNNSENPIEWHYSLHLLIDCIKEIQKPKYGGPWGMGANELESALISLANQERRSFLEKYGDAAIPSEYSASSLIKDPVGDVLPKQNAYKLFKDITAPVPDFTSTSSTRKPN